MRQKKLFGNIRQYNRNRRGAPRITLGHRPGQSYFTFGKASPLHDISKKALDLDYIKAVEALYKNVSWDSRNGNLTQADYLNLSYDDRLILERLHAIKDDATGEINFKYVEDPDFVNLDSDNHTRLQAEKKELTKLLNNINVNVDDNYFFLSQIISFHKEQYPNENISDAVLNSFLKEFKLDDASISLNVQKMLIDLSENNVDFSNDWQRITNDENLQKALIVAQESGFEINTNTFNFFLIDSKYPLKENESFSQTLANNYDAIQKIDTPNQTGQEFKNSCQKLQKKLVQDLVKNASNAEEKEKIFDYSKEYSYQQLEEQTEMLTVVNDNQKTSNQKIEALDKYESNAKKKSSGWATFGNAITVVLITGVGAVLGAAAGIGIGIAAGGSAGSVVPGLGTVTGAIVGAAVAGWKGATIGAGVGAVVSAAASTIFFNRDSQEEKMAKDVHTTGHSVSQ